MGALIPVTAPDLLVVTADQSVLAAQFLSEVLFRLADLFPSAVPFQLARVPVLQDPLAVRHLYRLCRFLPDRA